MFTILYIYRYFNHKMCAIAGTRIRFIKYHFDAIKSPCRFDKKTSSEKNNIKNNTWACNIEATSGRLLAANRPINFQTWKSIFAVFARQGVERHSRVFKQMNEQSLRVLCVVTGICRSLRRIHWKQTILNSIAGNVGDVYCCQPFNFQFESFTTIEFGKLYVFIPFQSHSAAHSSSVWCGMQSTMSSMLFANRTKPICLCTQNMRIKLFRSHRARMECLPDFFRFHFPTSNGFCFSRPIHTIYLMAELDLQAHEIKCVRVLWHGIQTFVQIEFRFGLAGSSYICSHYRSCFLDKYTALKEWSTVAAAVRVKRKHF